MDKYKRITKRNAGCVQYEKDDYIITLYPQNLHCYNVEQKGMVKLCELEDKIESGILGDIKKAADEVRKKTIDEVISIVKAVGINFEGKTMIEYDIYQNAVCDVYNKIKDYEISGV